MTEMLNNPVFPYLALAVGAKTHQTQEDKIEEAATRNSLFPLFVSSV